MHEPVACTNPPKRRGSHLVCRRLARVLDYAVTGADVVQDEVAEGVNYFVAESRRNRERSTIDGRSWSSGCESACVANCAAHCVEERVAPTSSGWNRVLATWSTRRSHEVGKCKHVSTIVLRILHWIEWRWESHVDNTIGCAGRILGRSGIKI